MKRRQTGRWPNAHGQAECTVWQCIPKLIGPLLLTTLLSIVAVRLALPKFRRWLFQPAHVEPADAIVVLGGGFPQRILHGINLYKKGLAPELWQTGNVPWCVDARAGVQIALEQGVPAEAVHLLDSNSTWQDAEAIAALVKQRQIKSVLVVTDRSHSRRALSVLQQQLAGNQIRIYYDPPAALFYTQNDRWMPIRNQMEIYNELAKIGYYWWRYRIASWRY